MTATSSSATAAMTATARTYQRLGRLGARGRRHPGSTTHGGPNRDTTGGVWMGGAAPEVDAAGNIWVGTGERVAARCPTTAATRSSSSRRQSDPHAVLRPGQLAVRQRARPRPRVDARRRALERDRRPGRASRQTGYLAEPSRPRRDRHEIQQARSSRLRQRRRRGDAVLGTVVYIPCGNGLAGDPDQPVPPRAVVRRPAVPMARPSPPAASSGRSAAAPSTGSTPSTGATVDRASRSAARPTTSPPRRSATASCWRRATTRCSPSRARPVSRARRSPAPPAPPNSSYWLVASDGGIFTFGNAGFFGSAGSLRLEPAGRRHGTDAIEERLLAGGLRRRHLQLRRRRLPRLHGGQAAQRAHRGHGARRPTAAATGTSRPTAGSSASATQGSTAPWAGSRSNAPIVGMAADPRRARLLAGRVRRRHLQLRRRRLPRLHGRHAPQRADRRDGGRLGRCSGYWLVASDGGVFNFGDAGFFGSTGRHAAEPARRRHGVDAGGRLLARRPTAASSLRGGQVQRLRWAASSSTGPSSGWRRRAEPCRRGGR